jgi:hypothetical protein
MAKKQPAADRRKNITAEEVIRVWQSSKSLGEAAERLGMRKTSLTCRISHMRKRGVPLKRMSPARSRLDYAALKRLAESLGGEEGITG